MKSSLLVALLVLVGPLAKTQNSGVSESRSKSKVPSITEGKALLKAMHAAASRSHLKEYTFIQETIRFDSAGNALPSTTWYEALRYPNFFRIDVGDPKNGRGVIYRNDSTYSFREGKLVRAVADPMPFMLLEGGLKYYSLEELIPKGEKMGYDLSKVHSEDFQGKEMFVLGAEAGDLRSKQIWIEKERWIPIRRIDPEENGSILEVVHGGFQRKKGKWVETEVDFFLDGKWLQKEKYSAVNPNPRLKTILFDPNRFGEWHWKK
jgi:hypothetical protein